MNQERKQIDRAARRGRGDRLARKVARRIRRRDIHPDIVAVEVVTGSFLLRDYFELGAGGIEPVIVDVVGRHDLHTVRNRLPEAT